MQLTTRLLTILALSSTATHLSAQARSGSGNDHFPLQNAFPNITRQIEANTKSYSQIFHYLPEKYFLGYQWLPKSKYVWRTGWLLTFANSNYSFAGDLFLANHVQEVDDDLEQEIEDEIEHDIEDEIEHDIEDEIEHDIEDEIEHDIEDEIEHDIEDEIEHDIEDEIEHGIEDEIEHDIEDEVEHGIEDEIEHDIEDEVEHGIEDEIEHDIEDEVEHGIEDEIEHDIEDEVEHGIEDEVEHDIEDEVEHGIEDEVEHDIEDEVEHGIEDEVEHDIEDEVEHGIEDEVERDVEENVEYGVERDVGREIEQHLEEDMDLEAEFYPEDEFETEVEDEFEGEFEGEFDPELEASFESALEQELDQEIEQGMELGEEPPLPEEDFEANFDEMPVAEPEDDLETIEPESEPESEPETFDEENVEPNMDDLAEPEEPVSDEPSYQWEADADVPQESPATNDFSESGAYSEPDAYSESDAYSETESVPEASANDWDVAAEQAQEIALEEVTQKVEDEIERQVDIATNAEGERIFSQFWLVLGDEASLLALGKQGFNVAREQYLPGLQQSMALLQAPKSYGIDPNAFADLAVLDSAGVVADFNHVYTFASDAASRDRRLLSNNSNLIPSKVATIDVKQLKHRVGMIDSAINQQHGLLKQAKLHYRSFTAVNDDPDDYHGTAVASILIGKSGNYEGVAPDMPLWAASVFFRHEKEGTITTTEYLIRALDWLVTQNVSVINMSLAGPANRILQRVIDNLCSKGVVIVAAVGNAGPGARPQYPAAYACSVAVTAISSKHRVYRNAVRGEHVDVAAYGVNLIHANSDGGIASSSGTSFATPLVSAYLAANLPAFLPSQQQQQSQWLEDFYGQCRDLGKPGWDPVYGHGMLPRELGR